MARKLAAGKLWAGDGSAAGERRQLHNAQALGRALLGLVELQCPQRYVLEAAKERFDQLGTRVLGKAQANVLLRVQQLLDAWAAVGGKPAAAGVPSGDGPPAEVRGM